MRMNMWTTARRPRPPLHTKTSLSFLLVRGPPTFHDKAWAGTCTPPRPPAPSEFFPTNVASFIRPVLSCHYARQPAARGPLRVHLAGTLAASRQRPGLPSCQCGCAAGPIIHIACPYSPKASQHPYRPLDAAVRSPFSTTANAPWPSTFCTVKSFVSIRFSPFMSLHSTARHSTARARRTRQRR